MQKLLLLGDEAVAQGAIDAGLSGIYGYPGTPSTEIMEYVQRSKEAAERNIKRKWSANEKTAMEAALGLAYAGKAGSTRSLNIVMLGAASPFIDIPVESFEFGIGKIFGRKGEEMVNLNINAFKAGREYALKNC